MYVHTETHRNLFFCSFRDKLVAKAILSFSYLLNIGWQSVSLRLVPRSHGTIWSDTPFVVWKPTTSGKPFTTTVRAKKPCLDCVVTMEMEKKGMRKGMP